MAGEASERGLVLNSCLIVSRNRETKTVTMAAYAFS